MDIRPRTRVTCLSRETRNPCLFRNRDHWHCSRVLLEKVRCPTGCEGTQLRIAAGVLVAQSEQGSGLKVAFGAGEPARRHYWGAEWRLQTLRAACCLRISKTAELAWRSARPVPEVESVPVSGRAPHALSLGS